MYQVTLTFKGEVIVQDVFNRDRAKEWYDLIKNSKDWNVNILKLKVDTSFNLKEEFL